MRRNCIDVIVSSVSAVEQDVPSVIQGISQTEIYVWLVLLAAANVFHLIFAHNHHQGITS